ncbi:NAD(P)/FAD-dependent oxidoreductase [Granulicella sp. dw_53]|uniref:phytoene desaturase family protein n=1 Tax=Granulicella sp. dw_53 TaxID=2719792 RepID=UPI001BD45322|nr:NAD(P)/FAD-dependent oxidoreductase [Granulicella sp. dw_53]
MPTATIIGSGPNGLAAAITMAAAGVSTKVFERNPQIGGGCSTAEITLPGFRHDLGSSVYPMGVASPFFRSLPIEIPWIEPPAACAHPLDDGTAILLEHSIADTLTNLDAADRQTYRSLMQPLVDHLSELLEEVLGPILHLPRHPLLLARFGVSALLPAAFLARTRFRGPRARALFAGVAAHSVLPLEAPTSAAVGLLLMAAGHASGWPILRGGAQTLTDALARHLESLGGHVQADHEVTTLPTSDVILADITPRQLLSIAGTDLPSAYRKQLERFRHGAGSFKIDYALSSPIPWTASECLRTATVHLGGTLEEIASSERTFTSGRPFVLLTQPSLFDSTRAPTGQHTAWAYCHVPNGSTLDHTDLIERQIERFAPGFRDCILARVISPPAALERWNPNFIGGDLSGGAMSPSQILFRPTPSLYSTPRKGLFLCSASTPPGGGVHGMAGFHAARAALKYLL